MSHHQARIARPPATDSDGGPVLDPIGDLGPCGELYEELQECLIDTGRSWTKCQMGARRDGSALCG